MNYSPDNFESYFDIEVKASEHRKKEEEDKKDQDALSLLDPTFLLSDFKHLHLTGLPRNWDTYFQHRTKNLYIKRSGCAEDYEYENVTDKYDWKQIMKNLAVPIWRYNKSNPKREDEYVKWLETESNIAKIIKKYTTIPDKFTVPNYPDETVRQDTKVGNFFTMLTNHIPRFSK